MKVMQRFHGTLPLCFAFFALAVVAGASPAQAEDALVSRLEKGKAILETVCTECHGLDEPLSKDISRAEWDSLLIGMTEKGARLTGEDKVLIVDFLSARLTFNTKCTVCHERQNVLDRVKVLAEWRATVKEMGSRKPGLLNEEEVQAISAYLSIVLGSRPAWMGN